ncbi:BTB/POZ domain-containing protein At3g05675-like [Impatiens glandulifera]|uniref:BTB/POZ domain-containing protein At3g05675-like n=1 Tax=Impatiens glandulifera TaxID=253017 RepID=UPI001FB16A5A|nr:BTB/POZ domain-containing protein At3g05675-like [Impatiens glandulifera]
MEKTIDATHYKFNDSTTSDMTLRLTNKEGQLELLHSHSIVLKNVSKFFEEQISSQSLEIDIHCSDVDYDHHMEFFKSLYLPDDSLLDSWACVRSAIGVLQVATAYSCEKIISSCIHYLEAVPWDDKEEDEILKAVSKLGPIAMPILARIQPVDLNATKGVLISAIRFATSLNEPCAPFGSELKTSAQEQIEYMLNEDEETPIVMADNEVKSEIRTGLSKISSTFENELSLLLVEPNIEQNTIVMQSLSDLEWLCGLLPKVDLMKDFVSNWAEISDFIVRTVEDLKLDDSMWGLKVKVMELTARVLEAVGYGNVILSPNTRVHLLKTWLPYIRKMKPLLDLKSNEDSNFDHKMDEDLCQGIEGAIVSLILALPSDDQADILEEWMREEHVRYPDLSEAFEIWCYRTKSANRRLVEGFEKGENCNSTLPFTLN